jgi:hypothetical protein
MRVSPPARLAAPPRARDPQRPRSHARDRGLDRTRDPIHRTARQRERRPRTTVEEFEAQRRA